MTRRSIILRLDLMVAGEDMAQASEDPPIHRPRQGFVAPTGTVRSAQRSSHESVEGRRHRHVGTLYPAPPQGVHP